VLGVLYRLCNKGNVGIGSFCVLCAHPSPLLQCYCFPAHNPAQAKRTEAFRQIRHPERGEREMFPGAASGKAWKGVETYRNREDRVTLGAEKQKQCKEKLCVGGGGCI
jgi:hypothetical protein